LFVAAIADTAGLAKLAQQLSDIGDTLTAESAAKLLVSALRDADNVPPQLVIVLDQAEFLLARLSSGALAVPSTELQPGWDEVIHFVDLVSRQNPTFGAYDSTGVPPTWVIVTVPDELTTQEARLQAVKLGSSSIRMIPEKDGPNSRAEMLVWSAAFQSAIAGGGAFLVKHVSPLSGDDVAEIFSESFRLMDLPRVDDAFATLIGREYDALCSKERASPLPLFGLFLRRAADAAQALLETCRDQADPDDLPARSADLVRFTFEEADRAGVGSLREVVRTLGSEAIHAFINAKFGDHDYYVARCEADPNSPFPSGGAASLHPEDARLAIAKLLRRLIRVRPLGPEADSAVIRELRVERVGGDELILARWLRRYRLTFETQLFHFGIVHENLVDWWPPARSWYDQETELLRVAGRLRIARETGLAPVHEMALPLTQLLAAWGGQNDLLSKSDLQSIRDTVMRAVGSLSASDRATVVRNALAANDHDLALSVIHAAGATRLDDWIELIPPRGSRTTPILLQALFSRSADVYNALRAAGADCNVSDADGYTPIHELAWQGEASELDTALREHRGFVRAKLASAFTRSGRLSPAIAAIVGGTRNLEGRAANEAIFPVLRVLIAAGADLAEPGPGGRSVLHYAARFGLEGIVNYIARLPHNAHLLHARNGEGQTPLHLAAFYGHLGVVRRSLEYGGAELLAVRDYPLDAGAGGERTPLWSAAASGHADVVEYLLEAGADRDARDRSRRTPLHAAAAAGALSVARLLVKRGAPPDDQDDAGDTPLHLAARVGAADVVQKLRVACEKSGRDPWQRNHADQTPLHVACEASHMAAALHLVPTESAQLNARDSEGRTALASACRRAARNGEGAADAFQIALVLLKAGADRLVADKRARLPLHHAAGVPGLEELCTELLGNDAPSQLNFRAEFGDTPLHEAAGYADESVVGLLLGAGAKKETENVEGRTAALVAAWRGSIRAIGVLGDIPETDHKGDSALHLAARSSDSATVQYLLNAGANVMRRNKQERFAANICAFENDVVNLSAILSRLEAGVSRKHLLDSAIRSASNGGAYEALELLLREGGSVVSVDSSGKSPLHHLAMATRPGARFEECAAILIQHGALVNARDGWNATALMIAAHRGRLGLCKALLGEHSIDLGLSDAAGANAMDYALSGGAVDVVEHFGTSIPAIGVGITRDLIDAPPIWLLATRGDFERFQRLVSLGVSPDYPDYMFNRPLHHAVRKNDLQAVKFLVSAGVDIAARNLRGETAVFLAAQMAWKEGLEVLLRSAPKGIAEMTDNILSWTPAHALCATREVERQVLTDRQVLGAIHVLRRFGAASKKRDKLGRTPAVYARLRNRKKVAAIASKHNWLW